MTMTKNVTDEKTSAENSTLCPYCGKVMRSGTITGDGRSSVKFVPDGTGKGFLPALDRLIGGVGRLSAVHYAYMNYNFSIRADFCPDCKKMIFDTEIAE